MKNSASYFQNKECEYFPCHKTEDCENFNCLFCYCPLYRTKDCGGKYTFTKNGVKDCSECKLPHRAENYEYVVKKLGDDVAEATGKQQKGENKS